MVAKVSVVIPIFQNEGIIAQTCSVVYSVLDPHWDELSYNLILVNDGSTDQSWQVLQRLQEEKPEHITIINFTRNFGQVSALLAGYAHADGDCVVSMSADLQDPPELIWDMVCAWKLGEKLVVANRIARNDGIIQDTISNICWGVFRRYVFQDIPRGGFDYFLMDREIKDHYVCDPEQNIFLQGRLIFYGYKPFVIPYERMKRPYGKSQTNMGRKLKYFIDGFAGYSFLPLRVMSAIGILLFFIAIISSAVIAWRVIFHGSPVEGWASLMIVLLLLSGIQMLSLGIIGEYLWRGIEETRKRPHYIIKNVFKRTGR